MNYFLWILCILFIWAVFVEPNLLVIKKITVKNEQLDGLKMVFASDFHIKPYDSLRLRRIVNKINSQNPDIVLLGGDYVNGHDSGFTLSPVKIASCLAKLKSKYGTFAVMGNHDGWQGKYPIIKVFRQNGICVLENENRVFDKFTVAGLEDLQTANPDLKKALDGAQGEIILLTHTPDMFPDISKQVALTLAGHTHGGQVVLPKNKALIVPSKFGSRYAYGLINEDGKKMFVSKGLGSSILPLRFNCLPEIVVINFVK